MDIRSNMLKNRKTSKWQDLSNKCAIAYLIAKQEIRYAFRNIQDAFAEMNQSEGLHAKENYATVGFINYQVLLGYC